MMSTHQFVLWNPTFSVEHVDMDAEHRRIMSALNRLHCLEKEGIAPPIVKSILQDLLLYTERHCSHEEQLMQQWKFSGCEDQREAHQKMIAQTRDLIARTDWERVELFEESVNLLNQCWVSHILQMDHEYIDAMHAAKEGGEA